MSQEQSQAVFVTFYSFKGGVGRSMALINTAGMLAGRGFRVLVIDLDLEAPGLSYLGPASKASTESPERSQNTGPQLGFVDLLSDATARGKEADLFALPPAQIAERYCYPYPLPEDLRKFDDGVLHIMPAGRFDNRYAQRFDALNLRGLYDDGIGEPLIRAFKKRFAEADLYDYVLVDSRTGFSDEAGICTRDLADYLMILTGLNRQNVQGTCAFLGALREATDGKKPFQIILSPIPNGEDELIEEREGTAKAAFEAAWGAEIPLALRIPYHPRLALTEEPHIFRRRRGYLFDAYRSIERALLRALGHDAKTLLGRVEGLLQQRNYQTALYELRRAVRLDRGRQALLQFAGALAAASQRPKATEVNPEPSGTSRLPNAAPARAAAKSGAEPMPDREMVPVDKLLKDETGRRVVEFLVENVPIDDGQLWAIRPLLQRLQTSDPSLADGFCRRLVSARSSDPNVLRNYAVFLHDEAGKEQEAGALFRRAMELAPRSARHLGNYASYLVRCGKLDDAEPYYSRAIAADPENPVVLGNYGRYLQTRERLDEAESYYKRALQAAPSDMDNLRSYAGLLDHLNRLDEAELCAKQAIKAEPENAAHHRLLAGLLERHGKTDESRMAYERAATLAPKDADLLVDCADFLHRQGEVDLAERYYRAAVEAEPESGIFQALLALLLDRRGKIKEARVAYEQAASLAPTHRSVLRTYAAFLARQGDLDHAERYYRAAVEADPKNITALLDLADFLDEHHRSTADAGTYYKQAAESVPPDPYSLYSYARFLVQRGELLRAEEYCKQTMLIDPNYAPSLGLYAIIHESRGDLKEAETYHQRAVSAAPTDIALRCEYADFLLDLGRFAEGERELRLALDTSDPSNLGDVAELCFAVWVAQRLQGMPAREWERALKFLLAKDFNPRSGDLEGQLRRAEAILKPEEFKYATALAAAVFDQAKVPELELHERWKTLEPVDPAELRKEIESDITVPSDQQAPEAKKVGVAGSS